MPRDAVSRTANLERNGGKKWVNAETGKTTAIRHIQTGVSRHHGGPIEGLPETFIHHSTIVLRGYKGGPSIGPP